MEYAILTQDREHLVPFKYEIEIEKMHGNPACVIYLGNVVLGTYRDMDRAKEVLDWICNEIYSGSPISAMPEE